MRNKRAWPTEFTQIVTCSNHMHAPPPPQPCYYALLEPTNIGKGTDSVAETDGALDAAAAAAGTLSVDNDISCDEGGVRAQRRKTRMSYHLSPEEVAAAGDAINNNGLGGERSGGGMGGGAIRPGSTQFNFLNNANNRGPT